MKKTQTDKTPTLAAQALKALRQAEHAKPEKPPADTIRRSMCGVMARWYPRNPDIPKSVTKTRNSTHSSKELPMLGSLSR